MSHLRAHRLFLLALCLCIPSSHHALAQCGPGTNCDDGIPATCDFCDPTDGTCRHSTAPCEACCLPDGTCQNYPAGFCQFLGGAPQGAGITCTAVSCQPPQNCQPLPDGSACTQGPCPAPGACLPRCMRFNPSTGQTIVTSCACRPTSECHVKAGLSGPPCDVPDIGIGTAHVLPNCPFVTPEEDLHIIDGLPPGTTIDIDATMLNIVGPPEVPGGSLGGTVSTFNAVLQMPLVGTGMLAGYNRTVGIQIQNGEAHFGPRTPGEPLQEFPCDMVRLNGQLPPGDPDFDLLRITAGTSFGLPSPGHTTLTQLPGGNWAVDSFFDITYRIDFVGRPGSVLGGMSGSTTGTVKIKAGKGKPHCIGGCPPGFICQSFPSMYADGTLEVCCDCIPVVTNGACCIDSNFCAEMSQDECMLTSGVFLGVGTSCGTIRACCLPTGGCIDAYEICCTNLFGGTPQPAGTTCQSNPCGAPEEACCLPDGTCVMTATATLCIAQGGVPQGPGSSCVGTVCPPADCIPDSTGTRCANFQCPNDGHECLPTCVLLNPATGQATVLDCDCRLSSQCHAKVSGPGVVCTVPDNGAGTGDLPPVGCTYTTPDDDMRIIDGLPAGTTIEIDAAQGGFSCNPISNVCSFPPGGDCREPGGSLGGEKICTDAVLTMPLIGTGALAGFNRNIQMPIAHEIHTAPRTNGAPIQPFDTDLYRLFGQIVGDPDFDLLRVVAGTDFGLPSPGHTTLTQHPGGNWAVDSFFDITYRIDFVGRPGSVLGGMSGSTTGTIRFHVGAGGGYCKGQCPPGFVCQTQTTVNADGTISLCCNCVPDQPQEGACCLTTGLCVLTSPSACQGTYLGNGTTCLGVQACCRPDGTCIDVDAACCAAFGGSAQGAGTSCATTTCEPPACGPDPLAPRCLPVQCPTPGQACLPRCVVLDAAGNVVNVGDCECRDDTLCHMQWFPGADPQCVGGCPPGFACVTTTVTNPDGTLSLCCDCVPQTPTGACCTTTGLCVITTAAQCNGTYLGDGTICLGVQACCRPDGTCIDVDAACCAAFGGSAQGAGTACATTTCEPPACGPDPLAPRCLPVQCPTPGQACLPRCLILDAAGNPIDVADCECRDDTLCHMQWVPGTPPQCVGGCPPGFVCVTTTVTNPDGTLSLCCDCVPQTPTGACCTAAGLCVITTAAQCNGTYLGDGTICLGVQACCRPDGTCIDVDAACCAAFGGSAQGAGTACATTTCEPPACGPDPSAPRCLPVQCPTPGQACLPRCLILDAAGNPIDVADCECRDDTLCHMQWVPGTPPQCVGGCPPGFVCVTTTVTNPDGTLSLCCDCVPQTPTGACCTQDGQCVVTTQAQCNGTYLGDGTICLGVQACCRPNGTCIDADAACCSFFGGTPQGAGTNCNTVECIPPQCGPDPNAPRCLPVACPVAGEECLPNCVIFANGQVIEVLDCECKSPNECHVEWVPGAVPQCVGGCPPGFVCEQQVTTTPLGAQICCVCVPEPPEECEPTPDGQACTQTGCPSSSAQCKPRCLRFDPLTGQAIIIDCDCRGPNACHATFDAAVGPSCAGNCPPGTVCVENRVVLPDGTIELCCDCAAPPCDCPGDINGDGLLNGLDVPGFVRCLLGTALPGDNCGCADINGDGFVNQADIPLFVQILLAGEECDPCSCPAEDISIDLSTGVDDNGNIIAIGSNDDTWNVVSEPPPLGILPRPAVAINPHPAWLTIPGTRWISANQTGPNGTYIYEFCFCLDQRFKNAVLDLQLRADDRASVFLNGNFVGATPNSYAFNTPLPTHIFTNNQSFFKSGENCVRIVVENTGGVVTGFNMAGFVAATDGKCCCPPQTIDRDVDTGVDADGNLIPFGNDDDDWEVTVDAAGGTVPRPATVIPAHPAWQTIPGTRWISAAATGPNGLYVYRYCFCLDGRFKNPVLTLSSRADDAGQIFLNGVLIGPTGGFNAAQPLTHIVTNPDLFLCGENCIEVHVQNLGGVVTGLNMAANITAEDGLCCEDQNTVCEPRPNGQGCKPVKCPETGQSCRARCVAIDAAGVITGVADCDCRSPNECHIEVNAAGGISCVGQCPPGYICTTTTLVQPDGTTHVCCDCELEDPPTGACCLPDGQCITTTVLDCEQHSGVYLGNGVVCDNAVIYCCLPDGTCITTNIVCCQARGGSPTPNGVPCAGDANGDGIDDACLPPPDACEPSPDGNGCLPSQCPNTAEICTPRCVRQIPGTIIFEVIDCDCRSPNECHVEISPAPSQPICVGGCPPGTHCERKQTIDPLGNFIVCCDCVPDEPGGVCCLPEGPCILTTAADCEAQGGVFLGGGGCDDALVFCCLPDGTCVTTNAVCCQARGGTPTPNGAPCAGDLNGDGVDDACQEPGGGCMPNTAGSNCMPVQCPLSGQECRPVKAIRRVDGTVLITECSCMSPNLCHLELVNGLPQCVGGCGIDAFCTPFQTPLPGGDIEIRCDCFIP